MQLTWGRYDEIDIQAAVQAEREVETPASEFDTPEWNEAFNYLASSTVHFSWIPFNTIQAILALIKRQNNSQASDIIIIMPLNRKQL